MNFVYTQTQLTNYVYPIPYLRTIMVDGVSSVDDETYPTIAAYL